MTRFESPPLFGRRVVVTRAREQAGSLVDRLRAEGAVVVEVPTILVDGPADGGVALRQAAAELAAGAYDWVVVTSANGAQRLLAELRDARDLGGVNVACIGPGTAQVLAAANVVADLVPDRFVAESLLDAFPPPPPDGSRRVLLARAARARDVLPAGLRDRGWTVDVVEAYRTTAARPDAGALEAAAAADIVTFTSSSTVERYLEVAGSERVPPLVACIGPVTAATARAHGLDVTVTAEVHTIAGLVDTLVAYVSKG